MTTLHEWEAELEATARSYYLILVDYQPVPVPSSMRLADWQTWSDNPENTIVNQTEFIEGDLFVSTVFLALKTYNDHQFETMVFWPDGSTTTYRWQTYAQAWCYHLIIAAIAESGIPKLTAGL